MNVDDGRDKPKVVALAGDLDIFAVSKVWESIHRVADQPCATLEIDLSKVEDFDPSGLQLLLALRRSCQERALPLAFKGLPETWHDRLQALGAGAAFEGVGR